MRGERETFMTWIKTVPFDEADEQLRRAMKAQRELYPLEYETPVHPTPDGESSGIVLSHSLIPEALYHAFATFGALMSPDLPLTRRDHELIAATVSTLNGTRYCSVSHVEFLRRVTRDDDLSKAVGHDYREATLSARAHPWCRRTEIRRYAITCGVWSSASSSSRAPAGSGLTTCTGISGGSSDSSRRWK